ncbi:MAG: sigma-54-dependent Fis family transcriptional regulator [Myxococcales bacterium]|nr:sigma-54-dependent Fis family transcriptional regulator [Myxococcales bacterium]MBL0196334.1 sigma-54-dependent Fis family transcriptional regulator [Myxococcales bacterium]HQY62332.1 sigma-54 dependent transcriptional regulator [Polyangiaceae bacterium]
MRRAQEICSVCGLDPVVGSASRPSRIVAQSAAMQAVLSRAHRFADASAPVVILGESGTGKEVVARALHGSSSRRDAPFVAVNVAALPAELLESELFGHARGAFTGAATAKQGLFEVAHGGTLFLDEVAEMPLPLQAKLLRVLQDGEIRRVGETHSFGVDARVVCATHRDLAGLVERGLFREDLYYRLNVLRLRVPPLRARPEDVLPLARTFLAHEGKGQLAFTAAAKNALARHTWPGNVRELSSAVKHGIALARDGVIDVEHLPEELMTPRSSEPPAARAATPDLRTLAEVERAHILHVVEACGGSQVEAARLLGIGRSTLWRKLRE